MGTIQIKRGTKSALADNNPVLLAGQPCMETDTGQMKVGNGTNNWNDLPYVGGGAIAGGLYYGSCSTAAATAAKVSTISDFKLSTGVVAIIKFTVTNSASSPTLNISSTGAKSIYYNGSAISASYLKANHLYFLRYNGTQYEVIGDIDTNTTYSAVTTSANGLMIAADKAKLDYTNIAYGTCSTAADTADKVVSVSGNSNWNLTVGSIIVVKFSKTNTAQNPTLNVNNKGAKSISYNNAVITTSSLSYAGYANRFLMYIYDGTNFVYLGGIDNNTDTKVTNTLNNYVKAYLTGTTNSATNTGTQVFDNSIYIETTAGRLHVGSLTLGNALLTYDTTENAIKISFT